VRMAATFLNSHGRAGVPDSGHSPAKFRLCNLSRASKWINGDLLSYAEQTGGVGYRYPDPFRLDHWGRHRTFKTEASP
jgi:hypothetical protein